MSTPSKLDRFDALLPSEPWINPWQADGSYRCDIGLLEALLGVAVGSSQRSGVVAGAADVWAAEELRRAGFDADEVWPRRSLPRVLPRDVRNFVQQALTKDLRQQVEARYGVSGAKNALPAEAHVMGRAYSKQSDVLIASWTAGVELLISTKTMLSSYQKNLRNRFEEGYGDAKNLRGRHPMAALGFLFVAGADIPDTSLAFGVDMLRKLIAERDVYDCACLLVIDGAAGVEEEDVGDARPVDGEPAALRVLPGADSDDVVDVATPPEAAPRDPPVRPVSVRLERVPDDLAPGQFFKALICGALDRMPVTIYPTVRERRASAAAST